MPITRWNRPGEEEQAPPAETWKEPVWCGAERERETHTSHVGYLSLVDGVATTTLLQEPLHLESFEPFLQSNMVQ